MASAAGGRQRLEEEKGGEIPDALPFSVPSNMHLLRTLLCLLPLLLPLLLFVKKIMTVRCHRLTGNSTAASQSASLTRSPKRLACVANCCPVSPLFYFQLSAFPLLSCQFASSGLEERPTVFPSMSVPAVASALHGPDEFVVWFWWLLFACPSHAGLLKVSLQAIPPSYGTCA